MKRDTNMPAGKLTEVMNFLPPPNKLVFPNDTIKITLALSKPSVNYLKKEARKHHIKYQRIIREMVDRYVAHHASAH